MKKYKNSIYIAIVLLSILAIIFSIVILVQKNTSNTAINNVCTAISPSSQCSVVQNSKYAKIFGIDNSWYGIFGFAIISILAIMQYYSNNILRKYVIMLGSLMTGILAIWFLYLQKYVLYAYCIFCIFVDIISIILLGISVYLIIQKNNTTKKVRNKK